MSIARLFFGLVAFFVCSTTADAATLYMEPHDVDINRGDTIAVKVRLDTDEDECINVIDGVVSYSSNIEPVDTSRGSSILSVWVEDPKIDKKNRTITFAGGIPNGYCGRIPGDPRLSNTIIELLFRSPGMVVGAVDDSDVAEISFDSQTKVLLNDGFGTDAPLALYGTNINLLKSVGSTISNEWSSRVTADSIPPEKFSIQLQQTPNAFSNDYYIVFNTTDKQSGIDHYEVMEEPLEDFDLFKWGAANAPWITARSPFLLKDQSLNSSIMVRAVDKAGNEYLATLVPDKTQRTMSQQGKVILALVITGFVLFILAAVFFWHTRRSKVTEVVDEDSNNEMYDE